MATGEGCSPDSPNCTCQWDIQNPLWGHAGSPAYPRSVAPASSFDPRGLDTDNWMEAALQLGASQVCLTVRHVDGFALWPTRANNYSVAASPWRNGRGDVVKDFVASARRFGISPCFYIILGFDVFSNQSGVGPDDFLAQQETALTELLTNCKAQHRMCRSSLANVVSLTACGAQTARLTGSGGTTTPSAAASPSPTPASSALAAAPRRATSRPRAARTGAR